MGATKLEREILDDVFAKTGLAFERIQGIPVNNKEVLNVVLPVLAEWIPRTADPAHRHAIYGCFHTTNARQHLPLLIDWWRHENDKVASSNLTQIIAEIATPIYAQQLWELSQTLPPRPLHYMLLARLAQFPETAAEVKDNLVAALNNEKLSPSEIQYISKVDDARIRKWLEGRLGSPDSYIRQIAKRTLGKKPAIPKDVEFPSMIPERECEVWSTEIDLSELKATLNEIAKQFDLDIPKFLFRGNFLLAAEVDRWMRTRVARRTGGDVQLWCRMEDVDTVELVITMLN